jgi:phosphonoacetaldehyde hydrolase
MQALVKIGDTISDIEEGINAGMWSVGIIDSSNEMGLTLNEINMLDKAELEKRRKKVREAYLDAGADYVIDSLAELKALIEKINLRLACGERP